MIRKKHFISCSILIMGGVLLFSGCATIAPERPKIEIPVPVKMPHKKQKTLEPSPSVSASAQQLYIKGQRAYHRGEYEEALKNFHSAAEFDSDFLEPQVGLGKIFLDIGQYEKATQTFAAVIKKDNSYFDAYVGLGEALLNEKDYDQSVEALNGALTLIPHHPKADEILDIAREKSIEKHLKLGKKKYSLGNLDGAKEEFQKVLKLHPQNIIAHLQMAYILEKEKKYSAAEEHLNKLLAEDNTNTDALRLLGKILSRTKRLEEAQSAFQKLLEINPLDQDGRIRLQAVQKALFSDPNIPPAFYEIPSSMRTTRGELAAILSLGLKSLKPKSESDVSAVRDINKHWAKKHIVKAIQTGLMHVKSGKSFAPNDPITRGELASIVYRIITRSGSITEDQAETKYTPYQDISPDHHLYQTVLYLYKTRIMVGEEKHYFGVDSQVPGIEALEVVDRLEEYLAKAKK